MAARRRAETKVFSLVERKLLEESTQTGNQKTTKPKKRTSGSRKPQRKNGWQSIALVCLLLLLLTTSVVALYAFHVVATLREDTDGMMTQVESRMQKLDSAVRFDSKRQQMLLGIRDAIMEANPKIGLNQAYQYSDWILTASEKYPSLDPVMFLAIGLVESGYKSNAVSGANAKGLYQIWPSTGRMLARVRGWEYTEDMLFDPEKNTEFGEHFIEHDSEREDVGPSIDGLATCLLGRHVRDGAHDQALFGLELRLELLGGFCPRNEGLEQFGQAEVDDLRVAVFRNKEVVRLDVAVDDAFLVRLGETVGDLKAELE